MVGVGNWGRVVEVGAVAVAGSLQAQRVRSRHRRCIRHRRGA